MGNFLTGWKPVSLSRRTLLNGVPVSKVTVTCIYTYTGCNRRNGPDFGRVFLTLHYIEKPPNTYTQSWTVWEIMAIENCGLPLGPRTIAVRWCSYQLRMPTGGAACERTFLRWFREMHGGWFIQCTSWYENAKSTHQEAARQACYVTTQHSSMMYSTSNRK
jgi:hypothetical protein